MSLKIIGSYYTNNETNDEIIEDSERRVTSDERWPSVD